MPIYRQESQLSIGPNFQSHFSWLPSGLNAHPLKSAVERQRPLDDADRRLLEAQRESLQL